MSKILYCSLFLITITLCTFQQRFLTFQNLCRLYNYPVQQHFINTYDGYVLQYFRLQAKGQKIREGKPVVYLQHGLVDSSDTWIMNEQQKAPAYILANSGYDVWVGNSRGNKYSNKRLQNVTADNYWNFCYDQMAANDLPAAFYYINKITGKKINYIGHSQGTMIMFAALAEKLPQVLININSFIALGPVTYLTHQRSHLLNIAASTKLSEILLKAKINPILTRNIVTEASIAEICKLDQSICTQGLKLISDPIPELLSLDRLPIMMAHFPSGTSAKNFQHYKQMTIIPQFRKYDYNDQKKNIENYGTKTPPLYNLGNIRIPVHLFVGTLDLLADVEDSQRLFKELKNSVGKTISYIYAGHAGFLWGKDMKYFDQILDLLKFYN